MLRIPDSAEIAVLARMVLTNRASLGAREDFARRMFGESKEPDDVSDELHRRGFLGGTLAVFPLTSDDAVVMAKLYRRTKAHGLSLGDRACLGLALRLGVRALTTDGAWSRLKIAVKVELIR